MYEYMLNFLYVGHYGICECDTADCCLDMCAKNYARLKQCEQNLTFCRFYFLANYILCLSFAYMAKNLFYDSYFCS